MAGLTDFGEDMIINQTLRGTKKIYVGLLKSNPNDVGNVNEINTSSYKRQEIIFIPPNKGETYNQNDIIFPVATENWGWITHIGLFDSVIGGNLIAYSELDYKKEIRAADIYKIPNAFFIFRLD